MHPPVAMIIKLQTQRWRAAIAVLALSEHQNDILIELNFVMVKRVQICDQCIPESLPGQPILLLLLL